MFLGYEKVETVEKPKTAELTEEQQAWLEQERRNNQAAVAAALATPTGAAAQAALGIPALGGTPAMSTAVSSRTSLQSASALQQKLETEKRARRLHVANLPGAPVRVRVSAYADLHTFPHAVRQSCVNDT